MIGAALFPLRVLVQLLRAYAVYAALWLTFSTLFFVFVALLGRGSVAAAMPTGGILASQVSFAFGGLHFMTLVAFRYSVAPRFPDVPPLVTLAVALPLSVAVLFGVWIVDAFFGDAGRGSISDLPNWMAMRPVDVMSRLVMAVVITLVAAVLGAVLFTLSRGGVYNFGLTKFVGGLLVGRAQWDDFSRHENERLQREYDDYVSEVRGSKS